MRLVRKKRRSRPGDGFAGKRDKKAGKLACRWRSCRVRLLIRLLRLATSVRVTRGLKLLHLVRGKNGCELRLCILVDGTELLAALIGREAGVGAQRDDLLLLGSENGLELRRLIIGEIEALAQMLRGFVRVKGVMVTTMLTGGLLRGCGVACGLLWGRLLAECCGGSKSKCQSGTKKNAFHELCSLLAVALGYRMLLME